MKQFIAPQILMVDGKPSPCGCKNNTVCSYCVQANLLLWGKKDQGAIGIQESPIIALRGAVEERGIRTISRELGVDHKTITHWIEKGNVPGGYVKNGELVGKEAIS